MKTFLEVFPWLTIAANFVAFGVNLAAMRALNKSRARFNQAAEDYDQAGALIGRFLAARSVELLMLEPEEEEGPHYDS